MMYRVGKLFPNKVIAHTKLLCSSEGGGGENMMYRVGKLPPNLTIAQSAHFVGSTPCWGGGGGGVLSHPSHQLLQICISRLTVIFF